MQMEDYLYQKDLFLPLNGIEKKSMAMKDKEWEVIDRKTLGIVRLYLVALVAFNFSKEKTMEDIMKELVRLYEKPSRSIMLHNG
jgi:hypothetical protein